MKPHVPDTGATHLVLSHLDGLLVDDPGDRLAQWRRGQGAWSRSSSPRQAGSRQEGAGRSPGLLAASWGRGPCAVRWVEEAERGTALGFISVTGLGRAHPWDKGHGRERHIWKL